MKESRLTSSETQAAGAGILVNGLAFALGVGSFFLLPSMPPWWLPLLLLVVAVSIALLRRRGWREIAAVLGFSLAQLHACAVLCDPFPEALRAQVLVADGTVVSLPDQRQNSQRFLFRIDRLSRGANPVDFRGVVRLSWYGDSPPLWAGERWRLVVRLKPPHGFVNPGGFDYERWLFQQGIAATGHVRDDSVNALLDDGPGRYRLALWRQVLRERLDAAFDGDGPSKAPVQALVQALVLGDRGGLTPEQWAVFSRTGTSHLIAISGLHIGLVAGFAFFLARWLWSRSSWLVRRLAAPRAAAFVALMAAAGYAGLAGFAISTQRALVMLAVVMIALMAGRTIRPSSALVLALVAVLLLDPVSVLSFGFWLSFGAVAVLLYALGRRLAPPHVILRWGRAQWAVAVGLVPMLLLFFGRASLVAPLVNLIAVPLFGLILPGILLAVALTLLLDWHWPLGMVGIALDQSYALLKLVAGLPMSSMTLGGRPNWVWGAAIAGALLMLAPRGLPGRWLGLVFLLPLGLIRPPVPADGEAHFTLLDVGQGLSAVVRTRGHVMVYDVGPRYPSGFETGSVVVAPYLRNLGVDNVDLLIASHADQDHVGGLHGLLDNIDVAEIISGESGALEGVDAAGCRRGQRWNWDGVDFQLLHPEDDGYTGNDSSCLLRVKTARASLLLPGDVERAVEATIVARDADRLRSDILVAAHHGSATSTSAGFLAAVDPAWVLYAAGYANRWGFPAGEVRERVRGAGVRSANTAIDGAIYFVLPAEGVMVEPRRRRADDRRIWRHRPAGAADLD
ncbi:MAG: DNA internalization-related competence protein ComEC/Rec2 [Thiohalocapsa sp.]